MKTRALKNYDASVGCEVYDIDLNSDEEIMELGRLCADQCIVFIDQGVDIPRLYDIMSQWGNDSRAMIHDYIVSRRLKGRHWREVYTQLGHMNNVFNDMLGEDVSNKIKGALSMITYKRNDKGYPLGAFPQGELDWHADQISRDDAQRMIGLMSYKNSKNSQTGFLCTYDAYESLSSDMKSMIKELVCKHKWRTGKDGFCDGMDQMQLRAVRLNSLPLDGMETNLYAETVTGRPGIKLPHHSFDGFVGMDRDESFRIIAEIEKAIYKDERMYFQDWEDGQIVFMDQQITLHCRPTNVTHGNERQMIRSIFYMDKIFPDVARSNLIKFNGDTYTDDEFARLVDAKRLSDFEREQTTGEYEFI